MVFDLSMQLSKGLFDFGYVGQYLSGQFFTATLWEHTALMVNLTFERSDLK